MHALFVSDVHLEDGHAPRTREFLQFLRANTRAGGQLFLNGDVFDVWPGTREFFLQHYRPVLDELARLVKSGVEVHYVEGNHDFLLGSSFAEDLGIKTYRDECSVTLDGTRVLLVHGDRENTADPVYPYLREVLRSKVLHGVLGLLPGGTVHWLGETWSRWSRARHTGANAPSAEKKERIRLRFRDSARRLAQRRGVEVVVMGHTHLVDQYEEKSPHAFRYFNLGDYLASRTYLEFQDGEFYTRRNR